MNAPTPFERAPAHPIPPCWPRSTCAGSPATSRASRSTSSRANSASTRRESSSSRPTRIRAARVPRCARRSPPPPRICRAIPTATVSRSRPRSRRASTSTPTTSCSATARNDILELVTQAFLRPGDSAVYSRHAFAVYPLATQARGATGIEVPATTDYGHDLAGDACRDHADDPHRVRRQSEQSDRHVDRARRARKRSSPPCRDDVLVVLDEAYNEYLEPEQCAPSAAWTARLPESRRLAHVLQGLRARRAARRLRHHEREGRRDAESRTAAVQRQRAGAGGRAGSACRRRLRRRKPRAQPRGPRRARAGLRDARASPSCRRTRTSSWSKWAMPGASISGCSSRA